jgi:S-adenosylmethionine hydrolase
VVDPGVGGKRDAIVVRADGRTFVGPDNGLFSVLWQRARRRRCWRIRWRPARLSASFHGRDLFAPVAAALERGIPRGWLAPTERPQQLLDARDLARVIYIDHYGNAMTGIRGESISRRSIVVVGRKTLRHARTFEEATGLFWYENSLGLVEIAADGASAARLLGLRVGARVGLRDDDRPVVVHVGPRRAGHH